MSGTGPSEQVQPATVLPWAAYFIVRDFERPLLEKAAVLEADPRTAPIGRQLRISVRWLRETGDRQFEVNRGPRKRSGRKCETFAAGPVGDRLAQRRPFLLGRSSR